MIIGLLLIILLILLNAFFVAAEFALVKVRYSAVEADAAGGNKLAKTSIGMLDRMDAYLSAAQIGITLASLALGWIGEPVVAEILINLFDALSIEISDKLSHQIAVPVGFILITVLHLIFGEAVPKYAAIFHPQPISYACALPLKYFAVLTAPLVWFINKGTWLFLAPFGIRVGEESDSHTEEELRLLLAESAMSGETGAIQKTEHELIEKVFTFDERVVRQIMVPRTQIVALDSKASTQQLFDIVVGEGYSRIPVFTETRDNITGVIHSKDVVRSIANVSELKVSNLIRPAFFVPETKKIGALLRELQAKRIHMAIVVDEFGVTCGLVTLEDIVEELVGEIQDEHDDERPVVEKRKDGSYAVSGNALIIDANALLPVPLNEEPSYSTVAGLLNVLFSGIPEVGQCTSNADYDFRILKRTGGTIDSVLLTRRIDRESEDSDD